MRSYSTYTRTTLAIFFAMLSLAFSGRYVAYMVTCAGMQQQSLSINEKGCCCCESEAAEASCTVQEAIADSGDGCCSSTAHEIRVDDYSARYSRIDSCKAESLPDPVTTPLFADALPIPAMLPSRMLGDDPPRVVVKSGSEIIYTITRQLRL